MTDPVTLSDLMILGLTLLFSSLGFGLRQLFRALRELSGQVHQLSNCVAVLNTEVEALKEQNRRYHEERLNAHRTR